MQDKRQVPLGKTGKPFIPIPVPHRHCLALQEQFEGEWSNSVEVLIRSMRKKGCGCAGNSQNHRKFWVGRDP